MKTQKSVRVHRFRDSVAFDCEGIETVYLDPKLAIELAKKLFTYAIDCEESYSQSKLNISEISVDKL